jgi:hypothetical protein
MRDTSTVDFGSVLIAIAIVAVLVAAVSYWGTGRIYAGLGREGGLDMTREPPAPASGAEVQEEIRQMLEAKSERRRARGEPGLDVEPSWRSSCGLPRAPIPACARKSGSS